MDTREALTALRAIFPKGNLQAEAHGTNGADDEGSYDITYAFVVISIPRMGCHKFEGETLTDCVAKARTFAATTATDRNERENQIMTTAYQPKTGAACGCRRGVERDNCANCEGTGQVIDFAAIRARRSEPASNTTAALRGVQAWAFLLPTEAQAELTALIESREAMRDALRKIQAHVTKANLSDGEIFVDEVDVMNWCEAALALADPQP